MDPTFLGIGAQRAGTTTLHRLLAAHPEVYVPAARKEIHFFDEYYERGVDWYRGFFREANRPVCGEVTPRYLYDPEVPERIHRHLPDVKLIALLRQPADRAYSQYRFAVRDFAETRPFDRYLAEEPDVFARGQYAEQLARYLEWFPREQLLVLLFEEVMQDPAALHTSLGDFLGVDPARFPPLERDNESYTVKHAGAFARLRSVGRWCRSRGLDRVVNVAKRAGMKEWFGRGEALPPLDPQARRELTERYAPDIHHLEKMLGRSFSGWRKEFSLAEAQRSQR